ncbi:MAG: adenylyl-sulfate kinase [Chloroflexi bacterium]|nr:MAG: adenylyl-sulfate kinase [Chloroflexota bacterium]
MSVPSGFVIWLTGLPASGKTSLAHAIQEQLLKQHVPSVILDSDELREKFTPKPAFTDEERSWFYDVISYLAAHLSQSGTNVLIAATGNLRGYREKARQQVEHFAEVFLQCPLVICEERDPKGIYALAKQGDADYVPGVNVPYEAPFAPELVVDMSQVLPSIAAESVIRQLRLTGVISNEGRKVQSNSLTGSLSAM